jgi:hypothetical protein
VKKLKLATDSSENRELYASWQLGQHILQLTPKGLQKISGCAGNQRGKENGRELLGQHRILFYAPEAHIM